MAADTREAVLEWVDEMLEHADVSSRRHFYSFQRRKRCKVPSVFSALVCVHLAQPARRRP
jgi:hypothetical protein